MKRLLSICLFFCSIGVLRAQPFNNEWIDYNKTYYKFKVSANGLYRITQSSLAGLGLQNTDVGQFQLWRNGQQIPIFTSAQSGTLPSAGYIEFWGEMNDGKVDLPLYRDSDFQISNTRNLFTDTASYFLTINATGFNKRLVPTNNSIPAGVSPEPYFMHTVGDYFNEQIHLGKPEGTGIGTVYPASYELGEGWASTDIGTGGTSGTRTSTFNNLFPYTGSGTPDITISMNAVGNANNAGLGVIRNIQLSLNGSMIFDNSLANFDYIKLSKTVPVGAITDGSNVFTFTNTAPVAIDRVRMAFIEMKYPRKFNFGGASNFRFKLNANSAGSYLEIAGFNFSGIPVLYDLNNGKRYEVDASNPALLKVFLQPSSAAQDLLLVNEDASNIKGIAGLEVRNFVNYGLAANQGDYLIITHKAILKASDGSSPVEDYKAYRSSQTGGGFNAKIYMTDQLMDQFAFGIKQNPLGIRNFIRWARAKFSAPIQHVLIAAKGVNNYDARIYETAPETEKLNLVPTFGTPGSDILLSAEGSSSLQLTPIGRVSVVNGDELQTYLDKVKQYEQLYNNNSPLIEQSAWKKNIIHMVGANDQATSELIYSALNYHKQIIQDTLFGGNVSDIVKNISNAQQQIQSERLAALINGGVSLLSYFGHSSTNSLGFNMNSPENYTNQGKYPVYNMMGCDVGNIFGLSSVRLSALETISEKYVLAKNRGCIAMMAGSSIGYIIPLDIYNTRFYRFLSNSLYGSSLGVLMQNTAKKVYQDMSESSILQRIQCEEFNLIGDPAVKIYNFSKPDYAIEDKLVEINPAFVSIAEDKFNVKLKLYNLGRAINQKLVVEVKRTYPDLTTQVIRRDTLEKVEYIDSLAFNVPIDPLKDKGLNTLTFTIDPENSIDELYESNNSINKEVYIFENDLRPVFPYNNSIVNKQNIKFSASTANPLSSVNTYMMELDTTLLFNSSLKMTQTKISTGGIVEFNPSATYRDSTVYYWRVAIAPTVAGQLPKWTSSSFIYINGTGTGYNQSHYYQFLDNANNGLTLNSNRKYDFEPINSSITVATAIYGYVGGAVDFSIAVADDIQQDGFIAPLNAQENSLRFYLINNKTMKTIKNIDVGGKGQYGSYAPTPLNQFGIPGFFQFDISTTAARRTVMNFIDSIPEGFYVALANPNFTGMPLPSIWQDDTITLGHNNSLYHKLVNIGLTAIDNIKSFVPFVFIFQKGNPQPLKQVVAAAPSEIMQVTALVNAPGSVGFIETGSIGPAKAYDKLFWKGFAEEQPSADNPSVDLIGVKPDNSEEILFNKIQPIPQQGFDISSVNPQQFPFIKLRMRNVDSTNYTPYQLNYWRVYYTPIPEGAIAPNIFLTSKDSLDAGEPYNFGVAFKNVSDYPFDSLKLKFTIRDKNNVTHNILVPNQKPLVAGDTIKLNVPPINTQGFVGNNNIFLEFNPDNHQAEAFHFNNFLYSSFFVRGDTTSPYMDVTFDGIHILNKDIVSSKPDILIKLTDDSKWLLLNNPDLVKIQLKHPDGTLKNYNFNSDTLVFSPPGSAANQSNTATISFKPYLLNDGSYELIIAAKDQSGNNVSNLQYRIAFQVINKPMISNLLNYPNPFTSSTAFVFTLTGSEIPQNIRIQILTITGKIVKEITKAELGSLKIGRNITEYKWDGTDQFGQKLANGIYLYRVLTNFNGKSLDRYKSETDNTDRYFKNGYGKMYLMR